MKCSNPYYMKTVGGLVGCGQCLLCRINDRRKWTLRLMLEARTHALSSWYALTYSKEFLPVESVDITTGQLYYSPSGTLDRAQIDGFFNRLRKTLNGKPFRYFLCGEYGDDNTRPHYHLCVFGYGEEIHNLLKQSWSDPVSRRSFGILSYEGALTQENLQYTVGYTTKKLTKADDPRLDGRHPEFTSHSRGIGVGAVPALVRAFATDSATDHISFTGDIPRALRINGRWWPLDRYLRTKILEELDRGDDITKLAFAKYKTQMSIMQNHREADPEVSISQPSKAYLLESSYHKRNAQSLLNATKRAKLRERKTKL
ncbi:MAG: replication initiator protein [Microviridae sp.]|nr:MAG: replication initiator protein [Microviridae sp.]